MQLKKTDFESQNVLLVSGVCVGKIRDVFRKRASTILAKTKRERKISVVMNPGKFFIFVGQNKKKKIANFFWIWIYNKFERSKL